MLFSIVICLNIHFSGIKFTPQKPTVKTIVVVCVLSPRTERVKIMWNSVCLKTIPTTARLLNPMQYSSTFSKKSEITYHMCESICVCTCSFLHRCEL